MALPITPIVNVTVNLPAIGGQRLGFDIGLIIGPSAVQNPTTERVVLYTSLAEMAQAGFAVNSPEYLAATKYFAATSNPDTVAIGVQNTGETALQAITACRLASSDWYAAMIIDADDDDHEAVAAYVEALGTEQPTMYLFQTSDTDVLNAASGNIFETLAAQGYRRTFGQYSTQAYAIAGTIGYPMGQVSNLANSYFTLMFKEFTGVTPENITSAQVENIKESNGNVYLERGGGRLGVESATMFSGAYFDEILFLDKLVDDINVNVGDLLYQSPRIPQTENGMAQLRTVIAAACDKSVSIGLIQPGTWTGASLLSLNTGDYLPAGYLIQSDSIAGQDVNDRNARIAPPIYVAVKLGGAIQSVLITVNVNR